MSRIPRPVAAAAMLAGCLLAMPLAAQQVKVRQGGTGFSILPLDGGASAAGFYAYGTARRASAFTGLEQSNTSLLMLYEQASGPRPRSLVFIHDRYDDGSPGEAAFAISGLPAGTFYSVHDDPTSTNPGSDTYSPDPPAGGATTADWRWADCCTDGAVLSGLEGERYCVKIDPSFVSGIGSWEVLSGPGLAPTSTTLPSLSQPVFLCQDCQTLSCPAQVQAECTGLKSAFVPLLATGSSLCGGANISNDRTSSGSDASDIYPVGTTRVVFSLEDAPGFTSNCETLVEVEDTQPPLITSCPPPLVLPCDGKPVPLGDPRVQAWLALFTASDVCAGVTLGNDAPAEFPPSCSGQPLTVTFTATDEFAHTATCSATVTLEDVADPVITTCPLPIELECEDPAGVPVSDPRLAAFFASFAASDDCGVVTLSHDAPPLFPSACGPGQATSVIFKAEDGCSRSATCTTTVVVRDTTPPSISCPTARTVECRAPGGTPASDPEVDLWRRSATGSDSCGGVVIADDLPAFLASGCAPGKLTAVTFRASDTCALEASCAAELRVVDSSAPAIQVCPAPLALECDRLGGIPLSDPRIQAWLQGFVAVDVCGPTTTSNDAPALFPAGCAPGARTAVELTAEDDCANRASCDSEVTVSDTQPPLIRSCPAPLVLECDASGGIPASDPRIQAWLLSFAADDACAIPTLANDAPLHFPSGCGAGFATTVEFEAEDGCANVAGCSSTLTVRDSLAPVITSCPVPLVLECSTAGGVPASDPRVVAWLATFSASDGCSATTLAHDAPAFLPSGCGTGAATSVTFTASDSCGSAATCTSTLTVRDTTPPAIATCPVPLDLECNGPGGVLASDPAVTTWVSTFAASDLCDGARLSNDLPALLPSGCGPGLTTPVAFAAEDNCANRASCATSVTVHDRTAPVISQCPAPLVLECNSPGGIPASDPRIQAWLASFLAADLCDGAALSSNAPALFPSGCAPGLATPVEFRAADNCGNISVCASTLTVVDTTPPAVTANRLDGLCLWPPNHKMYCVDDVAATIDASDLCDVGPATVRVVGCASDQPDDAPEGRGEANGDGHTTGDCRIVDGGRGVCVRAERLGGDPAGRHYRLEIEVGDSCGNATLVSATIEVPHDQSPRRDCAAPNSGK